VPLMAPQHKFPLFFHNALSVPQVKEKITGSSAHGEDVLLEAYYKPSEQSFLLPLLLPWLQSFALN